MVSKRVPVLNINHFQKNVYQQHPDIYVRLFEEHFARYQFIKTPHRHDFYFIVLFTNGTGTHTIDFTSYEVRPGSVFLMSPAQVHTWELSPDTQGYVVFFNAAFYLMEYTQKKLLDYPFFRSIGNVPNLYLPEPAFSPVKGLFRTMLDEYNSSGYGKEDILRSYLHILLLKLSGIYLHTATKVLSSSTGNQFQQFTELVEKHFLEHLSINEYADRIAVSPKQLYTICETALGKSPSEILQERLFLEAKRLLVHTNLSITQVASQLNFKDNAYFNRFFKKEMGMTPGQFRQQF